MCIPKAQGAIFVVAGVSKIHVNVFVPSSLYICICMYIIVFFICIYYSERYKQMQGL